MTPGSNWLICRPTKRLSGYLCRKKDSTSLVRVFCWLMAVVACIAIGLVYKGAEIWSGAGTDLRTSSHEDVHVIADRHQRGTKRTAAGHGNPVNGVQSPEEIPLKNVLRDQDSLGTEDRNPGKKFVESLPGVHETSQNSKTAEVLGVGDVGGSVDLDSKAVAPPLLDSSKEGIDHHGSIDRGAPPGKDTATTSVNLTFAARKFDCPSNFTMTDPDNNWFRLAIVQQSQKRDVTNDDAADDVIILTPISNVRRHLWKYFQNVCSLTYPHRHISIVLGEDSSSDQTFETAERMAAEVRPYFKRVDVLRLKGSAQRTSGHARHEKSWQLNRRRHLAMARNQLLFAGLGGGSDRWVLWMDSDVRHIPSDLVERFLWPQKAIVAANCLYRQDTGQTDTFDRNTWRDTDASRKRLQRMPDDFLMLEGYDQTDRKFLNDLKGEGNVVRLDGVGGCALFVEADLHRRGLLFPAFVFDHHVETEGMAKMAARLGVEMYGLPSVNVIHW